MKVVVAIDSLKGSLSSMEAGQAVKSGIEKVMSAEVVIKPLADGGEGTMESLVKGLDGIEKSVKVMGPLGTPVYAKYGIISGTQTAIIEMAEAAGITLVAEKNPMKATSYGVGELIKQVLKEGCNNIILGIGGSATNDGGVGMLQALGYEFFDKQGVKLEYGGEILNHIVTISREKRIKELDYCKISVACDVINPLCGEQGATYIYGPQKGVTEDLLPILEQGMKNWGEVTKNFVKKNFADIQGAGAAGGLGFALISYLDADLRSGIDLVLEATNIEAELVDADIVITGEGRLDEQTAMGKGPIGIAKLARKHGAIVIALSGSLGIGVERCNQEGIDAYFSILNSVVSLEEALDKSIAKKNMEKVAEQIFRLIKVMYQYN